MFNSRCVFCLTVFSLILALAGSFTIAFGINYEQDIFAEEVDGKIWKKMSSAERKAFWLGMYHMADTSSEERIKISTASLMAEKVTSTYQETGDWNKTVLEIAREATNKALEDSDNSNHKSKASNGVKLHKKYSGTGNKTTEPFTVNSSWRIAWEAHGALFEVFLQSRDGKWIATLVQNLGEGKGSFSLSRTGTYRLKINALGNWKLRIWENEE